MHGLEIPLHHDGVRRGVFPEPFHSILHHAPLEIVFARRARSGDVEAEGVLGVGGNAGRDRIPAQSPSGVVLRIPAAQFVRSSVAGPGLGPGVLHHHLDVVVGLTRFHDVGQVLVTHEFRIVVGGGRIARFQGVQHVAVGIDLSGIVVGAQVDVPGPGSARGPPIGSARHPLRTGRSRYPRSSSRYDPDR